MKNKENTSQLKNKENTSQLKNLNELLYFTSNKVVLYNPKINLQRYYRQNENRILSACVSNNGLYAASGE
jgi:hypothetical protein